MKKILTFLVVVFLPITSAYSVKMTDLYETELPVVSKSGEAKEQAVRDGLLQVLVKLSGNSRIDKNAMIRTSLKKADYYVKEYSYLAETADSSQYLLQIIYEKSDVNRLLKNANISYWGDNRPLVLVWLVAANKQNIPDIVSDEAQSAVHAKLQQESNKYGVPLIFPVMDMGELNHVSPDDVTDISVEVLNKAAKRYSPDVMLIGEIIENEIGVHSRWQLMINDSQWNWKIDDKTMDAVVSSVMTQLSQVLISQFAVKSNMPTNMS